MKKLTVTACTMMGHLLDMTHHPETMESARRWAREIASLPGIRHTLITETNSYVMERFEGQEATANADLQDSAPLHK